MLILFSRVLYHSHNHSRAFVHWYDTPDKFKVETMEKIKKILRKGYINTEFNPSNLNLYNYGRDDFQEVSRVEDLFTYFTAHSTFKYEVALSTSDDDNF